MDGNALMSILEMAKGFQKEIEEMKNTMRANHQDEIRRIEQNFELEKRQINETHQSECDLYEIDIGQKTTKIINLNHIISGKNARIDSLENSLNEKIHLIEDLQQAIKDNNEQIGTLQVNLDKKIGEIDDLRRINGDKDREYEKIKNSLDEKILLNTNLQSRLDNKENENCNLRKSERSKIDENSRLERRLREANQKIDQLNSTISTKNSENRNLQSRIDKFIGDYNNSDIDFIESSSVPKYLEEFVIDTVKTAIKTEINEFGRALYIGNQVINKFGFGWNLILIRHPGFYIRYISEMDEHSKEIYLKIGTYYIFIYKAGNDYRSGKFSSSPEL